MASPQRAIAARARKTTIRAFVNGVLAGVRRIRTDPWTTGRVRIDLPRDIEFESKASSELSNQFAFARVELRFKKDAGSCRSRISGSASFAWALT
jgi:hypothetical protein